MAGGSLLGGLFNRNAQRAANNANSPAAQVKAWEKAGINPLVGITRGQFIPQQAASIGDAFASAGAQFASVFNDDTEQELRETQLELQNEALRKQLDEVARPSPASNVQRIGLDVHTPVGDEQVVRTNQGIVPVSDVADPTPITPDGRIDTSIDDGGTGVTLRPRERVVTSDGSTVDITVGPEWDEILSGAVIEGVAHAEDALMHEDVRRWSWDPEPVDDLHSEAFPVMWPYELGDKPDAWDGWTNSRRQAYIGVKTADSYR